MTELSENCATGETRRNKGQWNDPAVWWWIQASDQAIQIMSGIRARPRQDYMLFGQTNICTLCSRDEGGYNYG